MDMQASGEKHVSVLTTGGTIASLDDDESRGASARLGASDLLQHLPGDLPPATGGGILSVNSFALTTEDALTIVEAIRQERARDDVAGVIVTHGTDTMEETAFLADLLLERGKPVVFTGAQLLADDPGTDGPRNLADAIRVAASPAAQGLGVLIVFDGDILTARDATKIDSAALHAFAAPPYGPLGEVDGGEVRIARRSAPTSRFAEARLAYPVDLVPHVLGGGDRLMRLAADAGAKGIVLAATGRGNATSAIVSLVAELKERDVPVLVTTRCLQGRVAPVYGQGGGADLADAGAIFADDLSGPKARLLLALILGQSDPGDIAARIRAVSDPSMKEYAG